MKTLALLFLVSISTSSLFANDGVKNGTPCAIPVLVFTDTTYVIDQTGVLVFTVYMTIDGNPFWCSYNPTTGVTTSNLPTYQNMLGSGTYSDAILVYSISSADGCPRTIDTLIFVVPPGTSHCDDTSSNSGDPTGEPGDNGDGGQDNNGNPGNDNGGNNGNPGNGGNNGSDNNNGVDDDPTGNTKPHHGDHKPKPGHGKHQQQNESNMIVANEVTVPDDLDFTDADQIENPNQLHDPLSPPLADRENFNLYPNPAVETIFVNYQLKDTDQDVRFQLVDQRGSIRITRSLFMNLQEIHVDQLESGVYLYFITSSGQIVKSGKLVIN